MHLRQYNTHLCRQGHRGQQHRGIKLHAAGDRIQQRHQPVHGALFQQQQLAALCGREVGQGHKGQAIDLAAGERSETTTTQGQQEASGAAAVRDRQVGRRQQPAGQQCGGEPSRIQERVRDMSARKMLGFGLKGASDIIIGCAQCERATVSNTRNEKKHPNTIESLNQNWIGPPHCQACGLYCHDV